MTSIESTSGPTPAKKDGTFEQRWDAWRARGVAHDRATGRRLGRLIPAIVVVAGIVYAFILMS